MWFIETPWPPAIVLLVAAVMLGLAWTGNRRGLFASLGAACLLLIPLVFLVERLIVTSGEEVETQIDALRDAVVRDDLEATLDYFSQTAVLEKGGVATGMALGRINPDVRITDLSVDVTAKDTVAVSHFRANGTFVGRGGLVGGEHRIATRWRLSWRKEAGHWKIFALERLHPINGEPIDLMSGD